MSTKTTKAAAADIKAFLPEGFSDADFETVGGLRPIASPEVTFNHSKTIVGFIVARLAMPPRKDGSQWDSLLVRLAAPAEAIQGEDIVTVEPGKDILIPVNGSLSNNSDLMNAAADPHKVFLGKFTVTGQVDVGKPSPMWNYEVQIAMKKPVVREGAYALYNKPVTPILPSQVLDRNGQTVASLVS